MTQAAALPPITPAYLATIPADFTPFATNEHERWLLRTMRRLSEADRTLFLARLREITAEARACPGRAPSA